MPARLPTTSEPQRSRLLSCWVWPPTLPNPGSLPRFALTSSAACTVPADSLPAPLELAPPKRTRRPVPRPWAVASPPVGETRRCAGSVEGGPLGTKKNPTVVPSEPVRRVVHLDLPASGARLAGQGSLAATHPVLTGQPLAAHRRSIPLPSTRGGALDLVRLNGRQRDPSPLTGQVAQGGGAAVTASTRHGWWPWRC